jgi:hypothetical protein
MVDNTRDSSGRTWKDGKPVPVSVVATGSSTTQAATSNREPVAYILDIASNDWGDVSADFDPVKFGTLDDDDDDDDAPVGVTYVTNTYHHHGASDEEKAEWFRRGYEAGVEESRPKAYKVEMNFPRSEPTSSTIAMTVAQRKAFEELHDELTSDYEEYREQAGDTVKISPEALDAFAVAPETVLVNKVPTLKLTPKPPTPPAWLVWHHGYMDELSKNPPTMW